MLEGLSPYQLSCCSLIMRACVCRDGCLYMWTFVPLLRLEGRVDPGGPGRRGIQIKKFRWQRSTSRPWAFAKGNEPAAGMRSGSALGYRRERLRTLLMWASLAQSRTSRSDKARKKLKSAELVNALPCCRLAEVAISRQSCRSPFDVPSEPWSHAVLPEHVACIAVEH